MASLETALAIPEMNEAFDDTSKFILPGNVKIMVGEAQDTAPLKKAQSV